ncbi:hypothetical protein ACFTZI_32550 [Streptomyces decoyicus]|uniref:hypothetical protein n=1 Tax=Streptomyces decoyicus TaxID=249567 RepID=UPI00363F564B
MGVPNSRSWLAEPRREGPQSVSVYGGKGGIGKSTDAFLASWMLGLVGPTLLINGDKKQEDGGVTALVEALKVEAPFDLTETDSVTELSKIRQLRQYRFVVTDNAPQRDEGMIREAANADLTIVPAPPKRLDSKSVMASTRTYLAGTSYRIHITKVDHISKSRARSMKTTLQDLNIPVFGGWMRMYNAHEMLNGYPVFHPEAHEADPKAVLAAEDAYLFGDEVLRELGFSFPVPRDPEGRQQ